MGSKPQNPEFRNNTENFRLCVWHLSHIFFYTILTQIMDSFSSSPLKTAFLCLKKIPEIPEYAEMLHNTTI